MPRSDLLFDWRTHEDLPKIFLGQRKEQLAGVRRYGGRSEGERGEWDASIETRGAKINTNVNMR